MDHTFKGCIKHKGKIFLPLEDIIAICKELDKVECSALGDSLEIALIKKNIPEVSLLERCKSFFK